MSLSTKISQFRIELHVFLYLQLAVTVCHQEIEERLLRQDWDLKNFVLWLTVGTLTTNRRLIVS